MLSPADMEFNLTEKTKFYYIVSILSSTYLTDIFKVVFYLLLYSLHDGLAFLHKYTSTERQGSWTDPRNISMCDTIRVVDG